MLLLKGKRGRGERGGEGGWFSFLFEREREERGEKA
jgi:hypothetical protein